MMAEIRLLLKKNIFRLQRCIWAVFYLKNCRWLNYFYPMPLSFRNLYTIVPDCRIKKKTLSLPSKIIVGYDKHFAAKQYICFGRMVVAVNR